MNDYVVLVDDQDNEIGTALKSEVHTKNTPLHRAFSIFIFNKAGEVLVQQRAKNKNTWGGVWSNSCCGHPGPGESYEVAINRRVKEELGIEVQDLVKVSDYQYRFEKDGIVENELCPLYKGIGVGIVRPDLQEVEDWKWIGWSEFEQVLENDTKGIWSPWVKEEVKLFGA